MIAIVIFAIMTVLFWACFEQAGGSMTIFAKQYTGRIMAGSWANIFIIANLLITVVPIGIITWVLYKLFRNTFANYAISNIFLGSSFVIIWMIVFWMINRDLNSSSYLVEYDQFKTTEIKDGEEEEITTIVTASTIIPEGVEVTKAETSVIEPIELSVGEKLNLYEVDGQFIYMDEEETKTAISKLAAIDKGSPMITATVTKVKENEVEIPATWFGILNSLFIIMFAPLFSKWWESKYNPSAATKYGLGLILVGVGFAALMYGANGIATGAQTAAVSIIWLILAYLFHTLGELCLSPVALSYISKLVPARMIALMFGVWYVAVAIGNKAAGKMGGSIEKIAEVNGLSYFFMLLTVVPIVLGVIGILLNPVIKKLMHGVR
jgi:POT family proton-dependent oligopeptide transporter